MNFNYAYSFKKKEDTKVFRKINAIILLYVMIFAAFLLIFEYLKITPQNISFGLFTLFMLLWIEPLNSEYRRYQILQVLNKKPDIIVDKLYSQDDEGLASHNFQDAVDKFINGDFVPAIISLCLTLERIDKTRKILGSIQITTSLGELNLSTIRATLVHAKIDKIAKISKEKIEERTSYKERRDKLKDEAYNIAIQIFEKIKQLSFVQGLT